MTEERLFDVEPVPVQVPSATVRRTLRQRADLARGIHPATGRPLLTDGTMCGGCRHAHREAAGNKRFWKCDRHRLGRSGSEASDIRVGWPACNLYDGSR